MKRLFFVFCAIVLIVVLPAHVSAQENETEMTGDFVPVGLGSETKQGTTQDAGEEAPHPAPGSAKDSAEGAETDIGSELTDTKLSDTGAGTQTVSGTQNAEKKEAETVPEQAGSRSSNDEGKLMEDKGDNGENELELSEPVEAEQGSRIPDQVSDGNTALKDNSYEKKSKAYVFIIIGIVIIAAAVAFFVIKRKANKK